MAPTMVLMVTRPTTPCPNCAKLHQENQELQAQLRALEQQVQQLQTELATARKNSSTSSKPPSSDIVKPPKPSTPVADGKRSPGGQPGHPGHFRDAFPAEQVSNTLVHRLSVCPECGGPLHETGQAPRIIQQIELIPLTTMVEEHQSFTSWCPHCRKEFAASLPERIAKGGLLGPQLTALIAYLKGACHASFSTIRKFIRDVLQIQISRGYLAKLIAKASASLKDGYADLATRLPNESQLNVDETGHKDYAQRMWTWCFRASLFTLFKIDASRGSDVLIAT